ncbi:MAG TPA: zf-HC2 domain-containing protein [Longimicrobiales bacterium]|nr:zf-HC2 domain-containing protein [Longimicrobiales bacterium]
MNDVTCRGIRELIPDFVASRLPEQELEVVELHVAACGDCGAELQLVQMILASRPHAPAGLLDRLTRATALRRGTQSRAWWGLSAAAIAALALGIGISSERGRAPLEVPGFAYEVDEGDVWLSDDGVVAGAPLLEGLSDEALVQLLDELSLAAPGGAA